MISEELPSTLGLRESVGRVVVLRIPHVFEKSCQSFQASQHSQHESLTMGGDVRPTAEDGPPDPEGTDPQGQDKRNGSRGGRAMHKLAIPAAEA